jgi:glyceraldehyde-3-phosphate dehydrogenase (NADP+)
MPRTKTWKAFIDGKWAASRRLSEVRSPWDGRLVGRCPLATPAQMERAVAGATRAFEEFRVSPAHERSAILGRIAAGLRARRRQIADLIVAEAGKPITYSLIEVDRAVDTFTVAAEEAKRLGGELLPMEIAPVGTGHWGIVKRFPIGPISGISPFNFPLNLVAHKVAPAIACGNTIILKPPAQTPLTALLLAEICRDAGLPAGVFSVVPCDNEVAGPLTEDPRIKKLTFTGSVPVGWMLKARANRKRVTLELGGNAAVVVDEGTDLDAVIPKIAIGAFYYAGQSCISIQRIYVHRSLSGRFERKFVDHVRRRVKSGDPRKPATVAGPLIDRAAADRIVAWLREAEVQGAKILTGGRRRGNVVTPAVVTRVRPSMKISCREVFGPVVTIEPWRDFSSVLRRINASDFGLQAGIFTADLAKVAQAYRDLDVGGVIINNVPTYRVEHMPYGGEKDSGLGREGIRWAIEEMTATKILVLNTG